MANPFSAAETVARDNAANQLTEQTLLTGDISILEKELSAKRQKLEEHRDVRTSPTHAKPSELLIKIAIVISFLRAGAAKKRRGGCKRHHTENRV